MQIHLMFQRDGESPWGVRRVAAPPDRAHALRASVQVRSFLANRGPEKCIDAVGMEASVTRLIDSMYDRAKQALMLETDRPHVLREMIYVCRP